MEVRYPDVHVWLTGEDGNALAVIGRCAEAARRVGVAPAEIFAFRAEATSGDYDKVLQTCMKWFDVH